MSATAHLEIPQDVLDSAHLTADEMLVELAVHLYAQGRLSIGKAHELAGLSLWEFRQLLGFRRIAPHFGEEDLKEDLAAWDPSSLAPPQTPLLEEALAPIAEREPLTERRRNR